MIEYLREIASRPQDAASRTAAAPPPGRRRLFCQKGRVVAVLPGVIAAAYRDDQFIGWYENQQVIFVVEDNDGYLALDMYGNPAAHPHVNSGSGRLCLGDNARNVEGAIASLLSVNLLSTYFMPRLAVSKPTDDRPLAVIRL
jgi:hypothetical protein